MLLYYPDGQSITIPDIDAPAWIRLHSMTTEPPSSTAPLPEPSPVAVPPALALINAAATADEISVLPTIGKGAAKLILEARPEGGYLSLAAIWEQCPRVLARPYSTDPSVVEAWDADAP
jgi:DNA uptake protein ComE-like DNA-binding protein